jgi:hypothetical protein
MLGPDPESRWVFWPGRAPYDEVLAYSSVRGVYQSHIKTSLLSERRLARYQGLLFLDPSASPADGLENKAATWGSHVDTACQGGSAKGCPRQRHSI